jgi:hypothetical protein
MRRAILCVLLAYAVFFQALATSAMASSQAARQAFGLDALGVICGPDGPRKIPGDDTPKPAHDSSQDCCIWSCGKSSASAAQVPSVPLPALPNGFFVEAFTAQLTSTSHDAGRWRANTARAPPTFQN